MVKSAANAGLPLLRPRQLGTQGFLCFSNIYPLIARGTAWDRKQDGVLLGPGTATVHTHIHQDKHGSEKTNRWADPDTYMHPVFNQDYSADNDGSCYEAAASSVV